VSDKQRKGVLVKPEKRLDDSQVKLVDSVSRELLEDPGLICYNKQVTELFKNAGAEVEEGDQFSRIKVPPRIVDNAVKSAPSKITLGAREPDNKLVLDSSEPRVRFGSGSETNVWLDVKFEDDKPVFTRCEGSIEKLCKAAHLADNLENLDFFIRCVNIRDEGVTKENKDVNKFLASLNNITKHVQAGLTDLEALDDVLKMGQIISGGEEAFRKEPCVSFITCVVKSPFQVVNDTASKLMEIAKREVPVVVSSSPMAGATAPFDEFGMVAQINAELLAGVIITQLTKPGAPVLYGAVPVRTRLDTLHDMYGAPEFNHYNLDCAQMARYYNIPCYSTAGVGDNNIPGIQATVEKMITLSGVPRGGAQYIHYAFGLLERTNVFCPEQAIMDDAHIGIVKHMLKDTNVDSSNQQKVTEMIREVMKTDHKTYMYHLPMPTRENIYTRYPLEDKLGGGLFAAHKKFGEILNKPKRQLSDDVLKDIKENVSGILDKTLEK
jgi:trimethylamine--corrinoid protein Co-methyltransferase